MDDLARLPACALHVTVVCPETAFERIVPRPGPAWRAAVRVHLAEWLAHDLNSILVDLPVGVHVHVAADGPGGLTAVFDDVAGDVEADNVRAAAAEALTAVAARIVGRRYGPALRRAKRQADAERPGFCPDCAAGRPVGVGDLRPGDRYRPAPGDGPWRDVEQVDLYAQVVVVVVVVADDGAGPEVYAFDPAGSVVLRDPWCGC